MKYSLTDRQRANLNRAIIVSGNGKHSVSFLLFDKRTLRGLVSKGFLAHDNRDATQLWVTEKGMQAE